MPIRRTRAVLVSSLVIASLSACGRPPVPVEDASAPTKPTTRELPPGHPPTSDAAPAAPAGNPHASGAPGDASAQVQATEFHFSGTIRIAQELHDRTGAAVFLSVRDQATSELILSSRHAMGEFEQDGETWVAPFRLDDTHRMMGGTSRPRDVAMKASYTPGGMLPAIGSTEPIAGEVTVVVPARAGVEDHEIVLEPAG
jgi:hypothetical protein